MKKYAINLLLVLILSLSSCTSMTDTAARMAGMGVIKEEIETFDGSTTITMSPAHLYEKGSWLGVPFMLGAKWSSEIPEHVGIILSYNSSVKSGNSYVSFDGLDINVNGKISKFDTVGPTQLSSGTYNQIARNIYTKSQNVVVIPLDLLREMLSAEDCRIRIGSSDGYQDANFSYDRIPGGQPTAKFFLKEFIAKVDQKVEQVAAGNDR